jgi:hypothetical protein
VTTTVIRDQAYVDGILAEDTLDWFAQDEDGNVWYFGEDTKELDAQGNVISTEGSWEAGVNGALPGIVMEAHPRVGDTYQEEFAQGVAEDMASVISLRAKGVPADELVVISAQARLPGISQLRSTSPMTRRAVWMHELTGLACGCLLALSIGSAADKRDAGPGAAAPEVAEPTSSNPVTAGAVLRPADASPKSTLELLIKVRIAPGHHIFAMEKPGPERIPTSIALELPSGVAEEGEWTGPAPTKAGSALVHKDAVVVFIKRLKISAGTKPGPRTLVGRLRYQACNDELCWPPKTIRLEASFKVLASP